VVGLQTRHLGADRCCTHLYATLVSLSAARYSALLAVALRWWFSGGMLVLELMLVLGIGRVPIQSGSQSLAPGKYICNSADC